MGWREDVVANSVTTSGNGYRQSHPANFVRRRLASYIAFMLIYRSTRCVVLFDLRPGGRFFRDLASRVCQNSPAGASQKRPGRRFKYLTDRKFWTSCPASMQFLPAAGEIRASPLRAQGAGEGPGLLAGRACFAAEVDGVGARGGAVE